LEDCSSGPLAANARFPEEPQTPHTPPDTRTHREVRPRVHQLPDGAAAARPRREVKRRQPRDVDGVDQPPRLGQVVGLGALGGRQQQLQALAVGLVSARHAHMD
jgi:hypothetical protein